MRNSRYYICAVLLALLLPGNIYGKDADARVVADTLEVHFRVGQSNIDMGYAGNEKRIADFTRKVELRYAGAKKESMQLNVYAGASPEGPTELNRRLGEQRGLALKELLLNRLGGIVEHVTVINQGARWGALSQMIEKSDEPWKYEVLKVLGEIPEGDEWRVDPRETKLRQLRRGQVWQVLNQKYLPELRSSGSAVLMELDQRQIDTLVIRDTVIYLPEPCVYVEEPADTRRVWAVKTNLLLWGVVAPNIQLERALGRTNHWSLETEFFWPWWTWNKNTHAEQFMNLGFELRYWMGNREKHHCLDGWHIGPAIAAGYYDFEWKKSEGWQGEYLNIYCNFGYQKRWGSRKQWLFDGGIGVGYIPTKFRHYVGSSNAQNYADHHPEKNLLLPDGRSKIGPNEEHEDHLMWVNSGWNHIFGLTHVNFSLGYVFGAKGAKPALEPVVEPDAVVDERARIKAENDAEAEREYQARYALMNAKERRIADKDRERSAEKAAKEQARAEKEQLKAEQYAAKQRIKAEEKAAKEEAKAAEKAAKEEAKAAKAEAKAKGEKVEKVKTEKVKAVKAETDKAAEKAAAAEAKAAEKAAKEQAKAEAAAAKRDEMAAEIDSFEKTAKKQQKELDDTLKQAKFELGEAEDKRAAAEKEYNQYQEESANIQDQIKGLQAELKEANSIIADSKNATVLAEAAAQEIVLNAEKRAVFLKQAALSESEKGQMLDKIEAKDKAIEELNNKIKETEMEKAELEKKLASLDEAVAELEKKVRSGGGAANGPMEYSVETIEHNKSAEVNVEALSKLLKKKSADGWKLIHIIDDDGGKLISSMGGGSETTSLSSLSGSPFTQKEDRLVLIFGRTAG